MNALPRRNGRSPRHGARRRPGRSATAPPGRAAGLTLVELLLALGIGMALFVTLLQALLLHEIGRAHV